MARIGVSLNSRPSQAFDGSEQSEIGRRGPERICSGPRHCDSHRTSCSCCNHRTERRSRSATEHSKSGHSRSRCRNRRTERRSCCNRRTERRRCCSRRTARRRCRNRRTEQRTRSCSSCSCYRSYDRRDGGLPPNPSRAPPEPTPRPDPESFASLSSLLVGEVAWPGCIRDRSSRPSLHPTAAGLIPSTMQGHFQRLNFAIRSAGDAHTLRDVA